MVIKSPNPTLNLTGTWGEFSAQSQGHSRTIGQLYFDEKRNLYAFDGQNYYDDGRPHCTFTTLTSHIDLEQNLFLYTFKGAMAEDPQQTYHGFGVLNLHKTEDNTLTPANGYFIPAKTETCAISHTMQKLSTTTEEQQLREIKTS